MSIVVDFHKRSLFVSSHRCELLPLLQLHQVDPHLIKNQCNQSGYLPPLRLPIQLVEAT